ncbi:caspase-8-like isoform X2, partial [Leptotrombidium deliense]
MKEDYKWCSYDMKNASPGVCLIININTAAINVEEREGSELDVNNLRTLMEWLNYDVITRTDLSAKQISEVIQDCITNNTEGIDSFMLFLMSHGEADGDSVRIFGADGHYAFVDKIIDLFNEEKCPTLKWKPKFLFFNFCRGGSTSKEKEKVLSPETNELFGSDSENEQDDKKEASDDIPLYKRLQSSNEKPILRDLLVEWRSINAANMREMIIGTRLSKEILNKLGEIQSSMSDLEVMQLLRTVTIICQKIGVSAGDNVSAIGLRKFLYLWNFNSGRVNPNSYTLNVAFRGLSVIINNFKFEPTVTSQHEKFISAFMRFKIIYKKNLKTEEIKNLIKSIINDEQLKDHDAFMLLIRTRMEGRYYLYGSDDKQMKTRDIMDYFNDDNCPFLKGKPKFIRFFNSEQIKYEDRTDEEIRV